MDECLEVSRQAQPTKCSYSFLQGMCGLHAEDPNLTQKRVLEGTLLEDLACPRKRAPGKKLDGNLPFLPMSPQRTPSLAFTLLATGCRVHWCGVAAVV